MTKTLTLILAGLAWSCLAPTPSLQAQAVVEEAPATDTVESDDDAPATESPDREQLRTQVANLLQDLRSDSARQRVAAEKQLVELGAAALAFLPPVTVNTPEEMRARLNRVRRRLQRALAEAAVKGSRVTLQGEVKLSEALQLLESQSGNKLLDFRDQFDQPLLDPLLAFDFEDTAYWQVLESVLDQAGLQLYAYTNKPNTLGYVARSDQLTTAAQAAFTELFRLEVIRVQSILDLRDENNQGLVTTIEVTWEPRVTPISIQQSVADLQVVGNGNVTLNPIEGRGITQVAVQEGISSAELEIPFLLPPPNVQRITSFKGSLVATIPGGNMTLEFDDLQNAREVTKGESGISVMLLRARKNRDLHELRVLLRIENASEELQMQRGWVYSNDAYLIDPEGQRVDYAGLESFRDTYDEIGLSYKFDAPAGLDGYKFIYKSPSTVMTVPVEYELKDIRLP